MTFLVVAMVAVVAMDVVVIVALVVVALADCVGSSVGAINVMRSSRPVKMGLNLLMYSVRTSTSFPPVRSLKQLINNTHSISNNIEIKEYMKAPMLIFLNHETKKLPSFRVI